MTAMTDAARSGPTALSRLARHAATLQLWTQIVGKIRLALTPWVNHCWQVPLYVTARGLGTSPIPLGDEIFELEFDFMGIASSCAPAAARTRSLPLEPQRSPISIARLIDLLSGIGVAVTINELPNEMPNPIRFSQDRAHAPTTRPRRIVSGARWSRPTASSSCSAAAFSARRARCISSGAASISR